MIKIYDFIPETLEERIEMLFSLEKDMEQYNKDCSLEVLVYKMKDEQSNIKGTQEAIFNHTEELKKSQKRLQEIIEEINNRDPEED